MKIRKLNLHFFKNHLQFELQTDAELVGVYGMNGKGKTNVLDAVYFLCVGKSYFSSTDVQCIMHQQEGFGIISEIEKAGELFELKVVLHQGKRKKIEKNGKTYARITDHLGHFFAVVIAPGDIELIYGANDVRRSFTDQILSQTDRSYLSALVKYKKLIEQRNAHLKSERVDFGLIEVLDTQILPEVNLLYEKRKALFGTFSTEVQHYYEQLSGHTEKVELLYNSSMENYNYLELCGQNKKRDLALQRSNSGIHKDEIAFILEGETLKKFGSQGQIKSFLIALKLAEYKYYQKVMQVDPFLLLDDIFEKIDENRASALTDIIKSANFGQIFVSDTDKHRIERFCSAISKSAQLVEL